MITLFVIFISMEHNIQTSYTFYYCTLHDAGFMICDNDNFDINYCCSCYYNDLLNLGSIIYDGINIINHDVIFNLDIRFNGGFHFNYFNYNYYDAYGNNISLDKNSVLYKWISSKK